MWSDRTWRAIRTWSIPIGDHGCKIKRADLPEENERAVFNRMRAERRRQANRYRAEGEETALRIRSETDKQRQILLAEAYREAEQARGEVADLDERSDVFGLGAILCEILTGQPPFVGDKPEEVRIRAREGRLEECFVRLEETGADERMIDLAKRCLAAEAKLRLENAGAIAREMESFLASVEERARRSELEAAEARIRAEEAEMRAINERRARRYRPLSLLLG